MKYTLLSGVALVCGLTLSMPVAAQVVAAPEAGTADFGIASQPIANVVANDTVNGAPATLGASGNATIAKSGSWPSGIGLNPGTGAVSTTVTTPVDVYSVTYQICQRGSTVNCATATDTVTVINAVLSAIPDSGTADFGIASKPIANVAANDSVNGSPATLGPGGNAVVAQTGVWQSGIALTPSTGAVSTSVAVPVGTYEVAYQLCDLNVPKQCATTTDTVTVINSVITPVSDSGTADFGIASQPVTNVAANDAVNGAQATLGPGGNAVVAQSGVWPTGIALTPATGAISTTMTVPAGTYSVTYQLCDRNTPKHCGTVVDTVTVITASIQPLPDFGTAKAGVASTPIANVVVNDTVDGSPATLGPSGNAKIGKVGTWPSGFGLNGTTGAVTTSSSVAPGVYDFSYNLCDLNVPANCASMEDEVTVTSSVIANPDTGSAVAGVASTPIHNVAGNDTVNGVPARIITSPNATVAQAGTWPAGIALNTATGAVTVTAAVAAGSYTFSYQLCQLRTTNCATAVDSLVVNPALVVLSVAGSAVTGTSATAISNVAAHDLVHGTPAALGATANAVITQAGSPWPGGIALNPATGAVTVTPAVAIGTYPLQYQLCDTNAPPNCATAKVNVAVTAPFPEVSVSPYVTGDIEFDWARDGLFCAACNFGVGNSQVNWTDRNNNLWVSGVDPNSGVFTPISGRGTGTPVDTTAYFWQDWGNGPEWAFSTPPGAPGGNPISQLVYSRYAPGQSATWQNTGAGIATLTLANGAPTWVGAFLPQAYTHLRNNTVLPEASQCPSDPVSYALFSDVEFNQMYTEPVTSAAGTAPTLTPFGSYANGIGERFVPCTTWLTFQGDVTIGSNTLQQVFWYDLTTQVVQQLTFDPTTKQRALMFRAPEFNGQYVLMALAADMEIQIYLQNGTSPNGAPVMQLINTIYSPDLTEPFMFDPKAFIHCSASYPTCQTYIAMGLSAVVNSEYTENVPNGLGVTNIDPNNPMFEILVPASTSPPTQRFDPKYFITGQGGPVLYYNALLAVTATQPYQDLGIYLINMQLGPPFGPCVGSSAHEGLNPTWPNCTAGVPP
jgi:hypothetical protein